MCKIYTNFYFDLCDNSKKEIVSETVDNRYSGRYNKGVVNDYELCGKDLPRLFNTTPPQKRAKGEIHFSPFALFCITFYRRLLKSPQKAKRA